MLYRVFDEKLGKYHTQEGFADNINEATLFSKEQAENLCATFSDTVLRPEVDEINMAEFNKILGKPSDTQLLKKLIIDVSDLRSKVKTMNRAITGINEVIDELTQRTKKLEVKQFTMANKGSDE